jgi:hypothetical protein
MFAPIHRELAFSDEGAPSRPSSTLGGRRDHHGQVRGRKRMQALAPEWVVRAERVGMRIAVSASRRER